MNFLRGRTGSGMTIGAPMNDPYRYNDWTYNRTNRMGGPSVFDRYQVPYGMYNENFGGMNNMYSNGYGMNYGAGSNYMQGGYGGMNPYNRGYGSGVMMNGGYGGYSQGYGMGGMNGYNQYGNRGGYY